MKTYEVDLLVFVECSGYVTREVEAEDEDDAYEKARDEGVAAHEVEDLQRDRVFEIHRDGVSEVEAA